MLLKFIYWAGEKVGLKAGKEMVSKNNSELKQLLIFLIQGRGNEVLKLNIFNLNI